ncbi:hypothetical protein Rhe02_14370 [Rhizocola hellebori]|uniref:Uncharacterized protein n=1 Tax=Rhizocola hellebori TaxID=1392758 RepID=A0A8J3VEA7_9ACTN|nr:hypothetical protein [Rhizocola hellebori]GIH03370.1 hypothetical protein Rhe02_14370 [Rhizocola hellebori]
MTAIAVTRRRKLVLAVVVVAAVLAGADVWTVNSHRLENGSSWGSINAEIRSVGPLTEARQPFVRGGQVSLVASIRNPGPWPVTITDVTTGVDYLKIAQLTMIHVDENTRDFRSSASVPFGAAKVGKGEELTIFATITLPDVERAPGSSTSFDTLTVAYRVLGQSRRQQVPMGFYLTLYTATTT